MGDTRQAPLWTCVGKRRFATEHYAERVIEKMVAKKMPGAERCHVYWCWHCSGFHLGRRVGRQWEAAP